MVITKDDYLKFKGINLDIELKSSASDNPTNATQIYIDNVRDFVFDFIDDNYVDPENQPANIKEIMKMAVLHQIAYFLEHGDLSIHNPTNLSVLSPNAHRLLRVSGLANTRRF